MDRAFPRPVAILFAAVVAVAIIAMFRSLPTGGDGGPRTATVVVVDAGHGGEDGGTVVFGLREKDLTLDLAHRLARALEVRGLRPVLTRTDDSTVPLEERVAAARANPGAVFVSLHCNRFGTPSVGGVEAYVASPSAPVEIKLEPGDAPRAYRDHRSHELAQRIVESAATAAGMTSRGVRESSFLVVRQAPPPAVIIECGYLSNPRDALLVAKAEVRTQLAEAIAREVDAYCQERRTNRLLGLSAWSGVIAPKDLPVPIGEGGG